MKIKKAIAVLASAIAMLGCIHTAVAADQLRFGIDPTFPPFESKNANGQLIGFDIDLGNAICAEMKVQCSWVQNSFDGLIPALQAKKFDAILSSLSITDERKKPSLSVTNSSILPHSWLPLKAVRSPPRRNR